MHTHIRTDEMEPKESQNESTGTEPKLNPVIEQLNLVAASSRALEQVIAKAYDLTSFEIFVFADLALSWGEDRGGRQRKGINHGDV